jgi:YggT family protein
MLVRAVVSWIPFINRDWHPKGFVLVALEIVFTLTDPPLKVARKLVPRPVAIGNLRIDLAFLVVLLVCSLALVIIPVG